MKKLSYTLVLLLIALLMGSSHGSCIAPSENPVEYLGPNNVKVKSIVTVPVGDGPFPVLEYGVMDFMSGRDLAERFFFPEQLEHNFCLKFRRKVPTRYHVLVLNLPPLSCPIFRVHYTSILFSRSFSETLRRIEVD